MPTKQTGSPACGLKRGAGASLLFPPQHKDEGSARQAILVIVRREPCLFGFHQSRWTLEALAQACPWLRISTAGGLSRILDRLKISYKRGRNYIRSPDRYYDDKLDVNQICLLRAWYDPEHYVFLYQDEFTYYRQPTLACAYEAMGHCQPLAHLSHQANSHFRILGTLNAISGQVIYRQYYKIGLRQLSDFYAAVRRAYPEAQEIYIAEDNWPIHFHPDVLARLQPQAFYPCPPKMPPNWPTEPSPQAIQDHLPIRLPPLPTYASWLNPIEKLWRWLKQEILHLHGLSDDWPALKQEVATFLNRFATSSPELLKYVGLLPN